MFKTLKIRPFTPIFIGSGDELTEPFEVLIDKEKGLIYYDYDKELLNGLTENDLNLIFHHLKNGNKGVVKNIIKNKLEKLKIKQASIYQNPDQEGAKIIHKHISIGNQLYIPGTTIKGVINTAFGLKDKGRGRDALLIRDSSFTQNRVFCEGENIKINPSKRQRNAPPLGIFEMIDINQEIKIKMKLDRNYINYYDTENIEDILRKVDSYTRNKVKEELEVLETAKPPRKDYAEKANAVKNLLKEFLNQKGYLMVIGRETQKFYKVFSNIPVKNKKSIDIIYYKDEYLKPGLCVVELE